MKKSMFAVALMVLGAATAGAQMMGGGRGMGPGYGTPGTAVSGLMQMMGGHGLTVAADGTAIVVKTKLNADGTVASNVVALRGSSAPVWSTDIPGLARIAGTSASTIYAVEISLPSRGTFDPAAAGASKLRALDAATGVEKGSFATTGMIMGVEPFDGGVYLVVGEMATSVWRMPGQAPQAALTLIAIGPDWNELWRYSLAN